MKNTIKQRLKDFILYKGITTREFERTCKLSYGYVANIRVSIQPDKVMSISERYSDLNAGWLMTGEGEMLRQGRADESKNSNYIPLIPVGAIAGFGTNDNAGISLLDCEQYAIPEFTAKGAEFLIRVAGSSMYPKYSNGDTLACRKIKDMLFFQWGKVYVIDSSQGVLVKRIFEDTDNPNNILCVSENKEKYPPFIMPKADIRSVSIVIGAVKSE